MSFSNPVSAKRYSVKKKVEIWVKGSWNIDTLRYMHLKSASSHKYVQYIIIYPRLCQEYNKNNSETSISNRKSHNLTEVQ